MDVLLTVIMYFKQDVILLFQINQTKITNHRQILAKHTFMKIINMEIKVHGKNSLEINKNFILGRNNMKFIKLYSLIEYIITFIKQKEILFKNNINKLYKYIF